MILLDMDGVLANFVDGVIEALDLPITHDQWTSWNHHQTLGISDDAMWRAIRNRPNFWLDLDPYEEGLEFYQRLNPDDVVICTMPDNRNSLCASQKVQWLRRHGVTSKYIITTAPKSLLAGSGATLIDDSLDNVKAFRAAGGEATLWKMPWNFVDRT